MLDLDTGVSTLTNSFNFTFASASVSDSLRGEQQRGACVHSRRVLCGQVQLRQVVPHTYEEAMDYLEGKRSVERSQKVAEELNSSLLEFF